MILQVSIVVLPHDKETMGGSESTQYNVETTRWLSIVPPGWRPSPFDKVYGGMWVLQTPMFRLRFSRHAAAAYLMLLPAGWGSALPSENHPLRRMMIGIPMVTYIWWRFRGDVAMSDGTERRSVEIRIANREGTLKVGGEGVEEYVRFVTATQSSKDVTLRRFFPPLPPPRTSRRAGSRRAGSQFENGAEEAGAERHGEARAPL
jgi:hypothetical protein